MTRFTGLLIVGVICLKVLYSMEYKTSAKAGCAIDVETGTVIWGQNEHEPLPPASLTKVATALTLLEAYDLHLSHVIEADPEVIAVRNQTQRLTHAPHALAHDGTSIDLRPGEAMTVEALLEGCLIASGNDASNVLAHHYGCGSIAAFVEKMNEVCLSIGCRQTHFIQPHGLYLPGHVSTAYDLAQIGRRAIQHPIVRQIVRKRHFTRPATSLQAPRVMVNTNRFLKPGPFYDPRVIGIKTGSLSQAGACLMTAADLDGREVVVVILGAQGVARFSETRRILDLLAQEKKVLRTWVPSGPVGAAKPVLGGDTAVQPYLKDPLGGWVFPSCEITPRIEMRLLPNLVAPIASAETIGTIVALDGHGRSLAEAPLVSSGPVKATLTYRISQTWKHWGKWGDLAVLLSLLIALCVWLWVLATNHRRSS